MSNKSENKSLKLKAIRSVFFALATLVVFGMGADGVTTGERGIIIVLLMWFLAWAVTDRGENNG